MFIESNKRQSAASIDQPFTKQKNFKPVQIQSTYRRQNKCDSKFEFGFRKGRKHFGEKEEMLVTSIFSFSQTVFKRPLSRGSLSRN